MYDDPYYFSPSWGATAFFGATAVMGVGHISYGGAAIHPEPGYHMPPDHHDPLGVLLTVGVSLGAYKAWRALRRGY